MKDVTKRMIRMSLESDETVPQPVRAKIEAILAGGGEPVQDKILSRAEASAILKRHPRSLDGWVRRGLIRKITMPGQVRAMGFLHSEINKLLSREPA